MIRSALNTARLPKPSPKPYIRRETKKARAMTICVGFSTSDCVVLGSDRQMTRAGINKYFEEKMFVDNTPERALVMVCADDLSLGTEVWNKLLKYPIDSSEAAKEALESILNDLGRMYSELPLQIILAVATKEQLRMISFVGKGIHEADHFTVIGIADSSLVRYLADQMHDCFSTTKDTVIAATYILNKAEQYIDGCDGTIDMTVLKRGPELVKIGSHTLDAINEDVLKNELNAFEALTSVSLPFPI